MLIGGKKPLQDKFNFLRARLTILNDLNAVSCQLIGHCLHRSIFEVMASRRLALNLNQALRSRAALKSIQPIKRGFATPIHQGINTESTTLSNGLTVSIYAIKNAFNLPADLQPR